MCIYSIFRLQTPVFCVSSVAIYVRNAFRQWCDMCICILIPITHHFERDNGNEQTNKQTKNTVVCCVEDNVFRAIRIELWILMLFTLYLILFNFHLSIVLLTFRLPPLIWHTGVGMTLAICCCFFFVALAYRLKSIDTETRYKMKQQQHGQFRNRYIIFVLFCLR